MKTRRCYCENTQCEICHSQGCDNPASDIVGCMYIGDICDPCADYMPAHYLYNLQMMEEQNPPTTG